MRNRFDLLYKTVVLSLLALASTHALAQMQIETINLQGRQASEMIEVLRPMVAPGGSITGTGYKLIIKSTPENIEQLRSLLADIDKPAMQLLISVSMDREAIAREQQQSHRVIAGNNNGQVSIGNPGNRSDGASISAGNDHIKYDARMFENRKRFVAPAMQQARVTEGLWASIGAGKSVPITMRTRNPNGTETVTTTWQQVSTGFEVMPRVNGESVTLSIRPRRQSLSRQGGGVYETMGMETTVSGRMNEWISLGGVTNDRDSSQSGIGYRSRSSNSDYNKIWVKVERAR